MFIITSVINKMVRLVAINFLVRQKKCITLAQHKLYKLYMSCNLPVNATDIRISFLPHSNFKDYPENISDNEIALVFNLYLQDFVCSYQLLESL